MFINADGPTCFYLFNKAAMLSVYNHDWLFLPFLFLRDTLTLKGPALPLLAFKLPLETEDCRRAPFHGCVGVCVCSVLSLSLRSPSVHVTRQSAVCLPQRRGGQRNVACVLFLSVPAAAAV